ncbi:BPSS1780 family membrane protein [Isoalcanivorax indicus]|uniref:BPSS1780 family membrane protein n=1 Tax=Isoalcanivorax indicus TaxID=2202653 RepID=UPI000DBA78EF|nr:BPSS1780 family membrane protein [Isoalcanivorax indicus]
MQGENPYQEPQAELLPKQDRLVLSIHPPRRRDMGAGWRWFVDAARILRSAWLPIAFGIFLLFFLLMAIQSIPVVGYIASQTLFMPFFEAGILMLGLKADEGRRVSFKHAFAGFGEKCPQLLLMGVVMMAALLGLTAVGWVLNYLVFPATTPQIYEVLGFFGTSAGGLDESGDLSGMAGYYVITTLVFLAYFSFFWFSTGLVFLGGKSIPDAITESISGFYKNIVPFIWYGCVAFIVSLLVVGGMTFLMVYLGVFGVAVLIFFLIVMILVFLMSHYSSFRDIYTDTL